MKNIILTSTAVVLFGSITPFAGASNHTDYDERRNVGEYYQDARQVVTVAVTFYKPSTERIAATPETRESIIRTKTFTKFSKPNADDFSRKWSE